MGGDLILTPEEVKLLKVEFEKILNILTYKYFETGLNAELVKEHLQSGYIGFSESYFEEARSYTYELLTTATLEDAWIRICR